MKGQIILILFICLFAISLNEAFSQLENEIEWEERSKINWEDFRGKVGSVPKQYVGNDNPEAITTTHIKGNWNIQEVNSVICQFQVTAISVTGIFEKNNSWVYENEKTDYLLEHEHGKLWKNILMANLYVLLQL